MDACILLDFGVRRNDAGYLTNVTKMYSWDAQDRLIKVEKSCPHLPPGNDRRYEYKYCATCGGALSERIEYNDYTEEIISWLRYEYEGLNLLRIDERYDDDDPANGIDSGDPWRPLNVFVHAPGSIGQIVRAKWFNYRDCTTTPCDSGYYYYFYDALGNVAGVYDENTNEFIDYEMDAFGNDLPGGNSFLAMDQPGPKEHLTGKMCDTDTGLYYFHARWYDPEVGRFVSKDAYPTTDGDYSFAGASPTNYVDFNGFWKIPWVKVTEREVPEYFKEVGRRGWYLLPSQILKSRRMRKRIVGYRYVCIARTYDLKAADLEIKNLIPQLEAKYATIGGEIKSAVFQGTTWTECYLDPRGLFHKGDCVCQKGSVEWGNVWLEGELTFTGVDMHGFEPSVTGILPLLSFWDLSFLDPSRCEVGLDCVKDARQQ